jgi:hypothetical protein
MSQLRTIAQRFLDAFHEDPGHSDLDREQPIHITVTLGDLRDLRWALSAVSGTPSTSRNEGPLAPLMAKVQSCLLLMSNARTAAPRLTRDEWSVIYEALFALEREHLSETSTPELRTLATAMLTASDKTLRWHAEKLASRLGCSGPYTTGDAMPKEPAND